MDERVSSAELFAQHQARMAMIPGTFENQNEDKGAKPKSWWVSHVVVFHQLLIVIVGGLITVGLAWCLGHKFGFIHKAYGETSPLSTDLALKESFDFFAFDELRWQIRKDLYKKEMLKQIWAPRPALHDDKEWIHYLENFFKPTFSCPTEASLGKGRGRVCESENPGVPRSCLIYNSFGGSQKPVSAFSGCKIYDVGVDSQGVVVHGYHKVGKNGSWRIVEHRLKHEHAGALVSAAEILGHAGMPIEILSIGPSGYPLTLLKDLKKVFVRQVVVEVSLDTPRNRLQEAVTQFDVMTTSLGYVVFNKAVKTSAAGGKVITISFLKLHEKFSMFTPAEEVASTDPAVLNQSPKSCNDQRFVFGRYQPALNITIASNFRLNPLHPIDGDSVKHQKELATQNHLLYAKEHGMNYFAPNCNVAFKYVGFEHQLKNPRVVNWDKFAIIQYLFDSGADAVVWIDPHIAFSEHSEDIGKLLQGPAAPDLVFSGDGTDAFHSSSFIVRNTIWSQTLLKEAYHVCPVQGIDDGAFLTILGGASPGDAEGWKALTETDGLLLEKCCSDSEEAENFLRSMPRGVQQHVRPIPWSKMKSYIEDKRITTQHKESQIKGASFLQESSGGECEAGL